MNKVRETSLALVDVLEKGSVQEGIVALITILSATIVQTALTEDIAWEGLSLVEQSLRNKFALMITEKFK